MIAASRVSQTLPHGMGDWLAKAPRLVYSGLLMPQRVFISYRRGGPEEYLLDSLWLRLKMDLPPGEVFLDVYGIPVGDNWQDRLRDELASCEVLLALIGPKWIADIGRLGQPSDWVREEIGTAIEQAVPIIPVLCCGAGMPNEESLPQRIRPLTHSNAHTLPNSPGPAYTDSVRRLSKEICGAARSNRGRGPGPMATSSAVTSRPDPGTSPAEVRSWPPAVADALMDELEELLDELKRRATGYVAPEQGFRHLDEFASWVEGALVRTNAPCTFGPRPDWTGQNILAAFQQLRSRVLGLGAELINTDFIDALHELQTGHQDLALAQKLFAALDAPGETEETRATLLASVKSHAFGALDARLREKLDSVPPAHQLARVLRALGRKANNCTHHHLIELADAVCAELSGHPVARRIEAWRNTAAAELRYRRCAERLNVLRVALERTRGGLRIRELRALHPPVDTPGPCSDELTKSGRFEAVQFHSKLAPLLRSFKQPVGRRSWTWMKFVLQLELPADLAYSCLESSQDDAGRKLDESFQCVVVKPAGERYPEPLQGDICDPREPGNSALWESGATVQDMEDRIQQRKVDCLFAGQPVVQAAPPERGPKVCPALSLFARQCYPCSIHHLGKAGMARFLDRLFSPPASMPVERLLARIRELRLQGEPVVVLWDDGAYESNLQSV
ncbi:MAG: toll/interleukin-1 receptor domain-containing protein [Candidatus Riflebacteria bacterium]|nr:toll/interleukin-1 receptor domain-containing protein [Candidatus Riflebacteria bacterium]